MIEGGLGESEVENSFLELYTKNSSQSTGNGASVRSGHHHKKETSQSSDGSYHEVGRRPGFKWFKIRRKRTKKVPKTLPSLQETRQDIENRMTSTQLLLVLLCIVL